MLGIDEDRAETFMYMMTDNYRIELVEWCKEDIYLRRKVEYLQKFVANLNF